jgi:hypothetical protein
VIWAGPFVQVTHQKKTGVHRRLTPQAMATPVPILFGTLRPLTPTPQPRLILGAPLCVLCGNSLRPLRFKISQSSLCANVATCATPITSMTTISVNRASIAERPCVRNAKNSYENSGRNFYRKTPNSRCRRRHELHTQEPATGFSRFSVSSVVHYSFCRMKALHRRKNLACRHPAEFFSIIESRRPGISRKAYARTHTRTTCRRA